MANPLLFNIESDVAWAAEDDLFQFQIGVGCGIRELKDYRLR
jgi:hypothetical protein